MKSIIIGFLALALCSCGTLSTIAVKDVQKTETAINSLVMNNPISTDCKAGWASGSLITGTSAAAIKIANAMVELANDQSEEFIKCRMMRLQVSFMIEDGLGSYEIILSKLVGMGIISAP
jgi:hypothetical protein